MVSLMKFVLVVLLVIGAAAAQRQSKYSRRPNFAPVLQCTYDDTTVSSSVC